MEPNAISRKIRVLVADSSRIHTQLLANALQQDPGLMIACWDSNPSSLIATVVNQKVDVLAISSGFGGRSGAALKIVQELHSLYPKTRIVVLLDGHDSQLVTDSFRAGARGVFSRESSVEMFCKCMRSVDDGQIWADSRGVSLAVDALAATPVIRASDSAGLKLLSRREFEVVECVVQGMTNREIAARLQLSQHTVKNYLFRVFDKLGVSSRVELLFITLGRNHETASRDGEPARFGHILRGVVEGGTEEAGTIACIEKAADDGVPGAQLLLAQALAARGGAQELVAAYKWFLVAGEQARKARTQLAARLTPKQLEEAQRSAGTWSGRVRQTAPAAFPAGSRVPQTDAHAAQIAGPISPEVPKPAMRVTEVPRQTDSESGNGACPSSDQVLRYGSA